MMSSFFDDGKRFKAVFKNRKIITFDSYKIEIRIKENDPDRLHVI